MRYKWTKQKMWEKAALANKKRAQFLSLGDVKVNFEGWGGKGFQQVARINRGERQ
jgi:hypothetical protein